MKSNKALIALCALCASALIAAAQDGGGSPQDGPPQGGPGQGQGGPGQGGPGGHRPPPSPLMIALDANHDGVIDAAEIANAPAALKTLDKNGDGKLTQDELRPQHPPKPPTDQ